PQAYHPGIPAPPGLLEEGKQARESFQVFVVLRRWVAVYHAPWLWQAHLDGQTGPAWLGSVFSLELAPGAGGAGGHRFSPLLLGGTGGVVGGAGAGHFGGGGPG